MAGKHNWLCGVLLAAILCCAASSPAAPQTATRAARDAPEEAFGTGSSPAILVAQSQTETNPFASLAEMTSHDSLPDTEPATVPAVESPLAQMLSPEELTPTLRTVLLVGILSLVPAVLVMTTCFARFAIVFGLLRQGLGAQQWLPNQIVLALSLFLTLFVMSPVWTQSYRDGIQPYAAGEYETPAAQQAALQTACVQTAKPVRQFMSTQIAATGNEAAIDMLLSYTQPDETSAPQYYEDVPLSVLLPAYLLSELKTAFLIGFQIVLPFLVIDLVIASVLTGMSLMMLPPVLVSLPFKLLLFVLIDGWTLTVEMLLRSVPIN